MVDVCYTVFASMYFDDLKLKTLTKTKNLYIKSKIANTVFFWVQSDMVSKSHRCKRLFGSGKIFKNKH